MNRKRKAGNGWSNSGKKRKKTKKSDEVEQTDVETVDLALRERTNNLKLSTEDSRLFQGDTGNYDVQGWVSYIDIIMDHRLWFIGYES